MTRVFFQFLHTNIINKMGNLKKKRRLKMNKHKRRKRTRANRHKKRDW
ncbi:MAG: AURKAIP1/COX24 domain-containing protein [Verrucomicrobiota bacterium]|nr:AURKAIP1/COX24 domain-containing protein [Verrucomicrobiota bacterium]